jgi:uncharacterized coiled-coil DUF342 family protein
MDNLLSKDCTSEDIVKFALSGNAPLASYIWDLEKLQSSITQRIQVLAFNYHENILDHQNSLQGLGINIKNLLKKAQNLQQKTAKLGHELEINLEKMNEGVQKLEKVQEAAEIVKQAQQFFIKTKKNRPSDIKDLDQLSQRLKGLSIIEKLNRSNPINK